MELTNYEMLDLAMGHVNASVDDLNRALALGSAYLLCAYKAGEKLSRFQVAIINTGFLIFVGQALFGAITEYSASLYYYSTAENDAWSRIQTDDQSAWVMLVFGLASIGAVLACFAFMWSVRHPKIE